MAGGDSALGSSLIGMSAAAASSAATALGVSAHTYHHSMMSPYSTAAAGYGCNMTSGKETQSRYHVMLPTYSSLLVKNGRSHESGLHLIDVIFWPMRK